MSRPHEPAVEIGAQPTESHSGYDPDARHLAIIQALLLEQGIHVGDEDARVLAGSYKELRASADRLGGVDLGELR